MLVSSVSKSRFCNNIGHHLRLSSKHRYCKDYNTCKITFLPVSNGRSELHPIVLTRRSCRSYRGYISSSQAYRIQPANLTLAYRIVSTRAFFARLGPVRFLTVIFRHSVWRPCGGRRPAHSFPSVFLSSAPAKTGRLRVAFHPCYWRRAVESGSESAGPSGQLYNESRPPTSQQW